MAKKNFSYFSYCLLQLFIYFEIFSLVLKIVLDYFRFSKKDMMLENMWQLCIWTFWNDLHYVS